MINNFADMLLPANDFHPESLRLFLKVKFEKFLQKFATKNWREYTQS